MKRSWSHAAGVFAVVLTIASAALASWPIPVQGVLKTPSGLPVTGDFTVAIRLYTTPTGGTPIFVQTNYGVAVRNGLFSVYLNPSPWPDADALWAGVSVGTDPEMTPRIQLAAVPFALRLPNVYPRDGRLGIGNAYPSSSLDVSAVSAGLRLHSTDGASMVTLSRSSDPGVAPGSLGAVNFTLNGSAWGGIGARFATGPDDGLWVKAQSTEVARFAAPGLLELKSSTGDKIVLYRAADGLSTVGLGVQGNLLQVHSDTSVSDVAFGYGSSDSLTETARITHDGRLGIGTKTPLYPVDIASAGQAVIRMQSANAPTGSVLELRNNTPVSPTNTVGAINFVDEAGSYSGQIAYLRTGGMAFRSGGEERVRLTGNGRLGVQTSNPRARVEINADGIEGLRIFDTDASWGIRFEETWLTDRPGIDVDSSGRLFLTNATDWNAPRAQLNGDGSWTATSDIRMKTDVAPASDLLGRVLQLKPVTFYFRGEDRGRQPNKHLGFVAQDVEPLFPSLVADGEYKSLNYAGMSVAAIGALQEYVARNDAAVARLRAENDTLRKTNTELERRIERLERLLGAASTP